MHVTGQWLAYLLLLKSEGAVRVAFWGRKQKCILLQIDQFYRILEKTGYKIS